MTAEQYEAKKAELKQALAGFEIVAEKKLNADLQLNRLKEAIEAQHHAENQDTYAQYEATSAHVEKLESELKDHWAETYSQDPTAKTSPDGILQVAISNKTEVVNETKVIRWLESEAPMFVERKPSKTFLDAVAKGDIAIPAALMGYLEVKSKYTVRLLRKKL